jgi:large subunit ribosomal protein L2
MPVKTFRPLTPSTRYITIASYDDITKTKPEKSLVFTRKKTGGRNCYGRVTSRGRGQGHKQKVRTVDFKRNKFGVQATVAAIEYDPLRSARLALLQYADGEKRYIMHQTMQVGAKVLSGESPAGNGNASACVPMEYYAQPRNHSRQRRPVTSAGGAATLMS